MRRSIALRVLALVAGAHVAAAQEAAPRSADGASYRSLSSLSGASGLRSSVGGMSDFRSSASRPAWSEPRWSAWPPVQMSDSALRESPERGSELRPSATRGSDLRESAPSWSAPRWSEWRESQASVSYAVRMPTLGEARAQVIHPAAPPPVSMDFTLWSSERLRPGDVLAALPPVFMTMVSNGRTYYFFDDVYYAAAADAEDGATVYEVVVPPIGARFSRLPAGAEEVGIGSAVYYRSGERYYQWIDGAYVVVEPPEASDAPTPTPQ